MHNDIEDIRKRIDRVLNTRLRPAIAVTRQELSVSTWTVDGDPVPFADAVAREFLPTVTGARWGSPWRTTWFLVEGQAPADDAPMEVSVDIGFTEGPGFNAEGMVFTATGTIVKAINPLNTHVPLEAVADPAGCVRFYVEAAANPAIFGFDPTDLGDIETAPTDPLYMFRHARIVQRELDVAELVADIDVLWGLAEQLPADLPRRWSLYRSIDRALDALDYADIAGTAARARAQLADELAKPAYASAHVVSAVGHAHIDSAWLWPLRETVRKVGRTIANVLAIADTDPEFVFAFSSAQQHAWLKERYPQLWERLKEAVRRGQVVPVGGMWVESDTVMPSGESMVRQFLHGKRFFLEEYGIETTDAWLPDSFGYSAALPQIIAKAGNRYFLSQKPSWNRTNHFPHHSFAWEGIDGTRVFAHLPPVDTYTSQLSASELHHAEANYAEKGFANSSLVPYGWGDGGGGPTREMLARAHRLTDLEGSPRVLLESPNTFFAKASAELDSPAVWAGEIYMEGHRGTLTTQRAMKRGNRRVESLLREAEAWSATAAIRGSADYPYDELDRLWKTALLLQFHDILPGSSIRWVHREAAATYLELEADLLGMIDAAQCALAGDGDDVLLFNGSMSEIAGVPAFGARVATVSNPVAPRVDGDGYVLDNGLVRARVDGHGEIESLRDLIVDRELVAAGRKLNELLIHQDTPSLWDAWDIDEFYRRSAFVLDAPTVSEVRHGSVMVTRTFGRSRITQTISLSADSPRLDIETTVDWNEDERFLRAYFPLALVATESSAETQFGIVRRRVDENTSWTWAQFEIAAHRFLHVDEGGYGVAIVNDSIYGHSVDRSRDRDDQPSTTVGLSMVRAPKHPDPTADLGTHSFRYSLVVGCTVEEATAEGSLLNNPPRTRPGASAVSPLVSSNRENVLVSAVKLAEDRSGDLVVRLYECAGRRTSAAVTIDVAGAVQVADLIERPERSVIARSGKGSFDVTLMPFEIVTLRVTPEAELSANPFEEKES